MGALVGAGARTWRVTRIQMFTTTRRPSGGVRRERNPAPIRIIMGNNDTSGDLVTLLGMSACVGASEAGRRLLIFVGILCVLGQVQRPVDSRRHAMFFRKKTPEEEQSMPSRLSIHLRLCARVPRPIADEGSRCTTCCGETTVMKIRCAPRSGMRRIRFGARFSSAYELRAGHGAAQRRRACARGDEQYKLARNI
jgi:hypothetical protein